MALERMGEENETIVDTQKKPQKESIIRERKTGYRQIEKNVKEYS